MRLKDWVLTTDRFKERARRCIAETLIDHTNDREQSERLNRIERRDRIPKEIEKEVQVNDRDEGVTNAHVLMVIINRIESLQRTIQLEYSRERKVRLEEIKERLKILIEKRHIVTEGSQEEEEVLIEIERVKQELKEDVERVDEAGRVRVRNFELDKTGKNNAYTFQVVKERKSRKQIKKLRVGDDEIQEPVEIMSKLQQKYQGIVGQPYDTEMELEEFVNKYEIEFDLINEGNWMENEFTPEEVLEAIKNASKNAAPGPTGHTPSLYAYIFSEIPLLFTKAINELIFVPKLIKAPVFRWLQHRNIVYIPKPNKDAELIENLRPLSMLEAFYKVMSRVMAYRLIKATVDTGARDQHGFVTGKSCQTALLPVIAGADDAAKKGRPLQLLAVDISSAFDTIHPPLIHQVMLKQQLPNIYSEALHYLTTGGTAAVRYNNHDGEIFTVETGSGQGDPPSAPRFTTGTDPLTRALDKVTKDFRYKLDGETLPVSVFADDNMLPLSIQTLADFEKIIEIFDDFYKISGLKINLKKTEILAINTDPDLLLAIKNRYGIKIVQSVTYLGIEITGTYQETKRATYNKAVGKIKEKCCKIKRAHVSMLHKKQLIKQAVIPMINHIAMSVGGGEEQMTVIDNILRETMWTRTVKGVEISGRKIIAKKRFDMSYNMGGLQLEKVENTVRRILLNSLQRYITVERERGPYSNILLDQNLVENGFLSIQDMLEYGPLQWKRIHESVLITPIMRDMAEAYMELLIINEKDNEGWLSSALVGHTIGNKLEQIIRGEGEILKQAGIRIVADLFPHDSITGKLDLKNDRVYDNVYLHPHSQLFS
jgi:hypothetical protein